MSYDFSLRANLGGPRDCPLENTWYNYTSNVRDFFTWFLRRPLTDFDNKKARELMQAIESGFKRFYNHDWEEKVSIESLKQFDSPNGWGNTLGAIAFLFDMYKSCIYAPQAIVSINS